MNRRWVALLLTLAAHLLLASLYFAYRGALLLPPLLRADTPQARFGAAAGPWIDRARTTTIEQYRSPEGVIIERINRGGGSSCYMRGVVNFARGNPHDSGTPRAVACPPPGSGWSRK